MALNNIKSVGDEQQWKLQVESYIKELQSQVAVLQAQVNSRGTL
jgi:hypothetical protein